MRPIWQIVVAVAIATAIFFVLDYADLDPRDPIRIGHSLVN